MRTVYEMKLYNIYYLCKELIDVFKKITVSPVDNNKRDYYRISGLENYWDGLETLHNISLFESTVKHLYNIIPVLSRDNDVLEVSADICHSIESANNTIINQMSVIIKLYESMHLPESHIGIDVISTDIV